MRCVTLTLLSAINISAGSGDLSGDKTRRGNPEEPTASNQP
jgi:hypothetical protein